MQYPPLTQFGQTNLANSIFVTSQPPLHGRQWSLVAPPGALPPRFPIRHPAPDLFLRCLSPGWGRPGCPRWNMGCPGTTVRELTNPSFQTLLTKTNAILDIRSMKSIRIMCLVYNRNVKELDIQIKHKAMSKAYNILWCTLINQANQVKKNKDYVYGKWEYWICLFHTCGLTWYLVEK